MVGLGEVVVEAAPLKFGSSVPCKEMPLERCTQLNALRCCVERADLRTRRRGDCVVPDSWCHVLLAWTSPRQTAVAAGWH